MKKIKIISIFLTVMLCMAAFVVSVSASDRYYASDESGDNTPPPSIDSITIDTENVKLPENQGSEPLTPDGNLTLIDDILQDGGYYASAETMLQDKQFITIQSKSGNWFYLIIDRSGDTENVYFLNLVDEADLMALMETGETEAAEPVPEVCICIDKCEAGSVNESCPVCVKNKSKCIGSEKPTNTEPTDEPVTNPEKTNNSGLLIILLVLALAGGGAFYYFKFVKDKTKTKGNDNLDSYDFGEDDDTEYEIEDESDNNEPDSDK